MEGLLWHLFPISYVHITYVYTGYHETAPNGFINYEGDDQSEVNEDDAYPEDGPLYSGTHSLKRIRGTTPSKTQMVRKNWIV